MQLINFIQQQLELNKGQNIISINVIDKSPITDYMLICTATSSRHANALADKLKEASKQENIAILTTVGEATAEWVIVDFGECIVHIMQQAARDLYQLEKLWV